MGHGGDDETRRIILARRARFLAAALAGVAATGTVAAAAEGCGGETEQSDGGTPQPCLSPPSNPDAQPQPCLSKIAEDAGLDAATDAKLDADAEPQPCLAPPPGDDGG